MIGIGHINEAYRNGIDDEVDETKSDQPVNEASHLVNSGKKLRQNSASTFYQSNKNRIGFGNQHFQ